MFFMRLTYHWICPVFLSSVVCGGVLSSKISRQYCPFDFPIWSCSFACPCCTVLQNVETKAPVSFVPQGSFLNSGCLFRFLSLPVAFLLGINPIARHHTLLVVFVIARLHSSAHIFGYLRQPDGICYSKPYSFQHTLLHMPERRIRLKCRNTNLHAGRWIARI